MCVIQAPDQVRGHWQRGMEAARDDVAIVRLVGSQLLDLPAGNQADSVTALASQGDQLLQPRYTRNRRSQSCTFSNQGSS